MRLGHDGMRGKALHTAEGNVAHGHGQRCTRPRATRGAGGKNEKVGVFLFLKTGCQRVAYRSTKKGDLSNIFTAWVGLARLCAGFFAYFTQEAAVAGWLWQWPDICGKVTGLHRVQDGWFRGVGTLHAARIGHKKAHAGRRGAGAHGPCMGWCVKCALRHPRAGRRVRGRDGLTRGRCSRRGRSGSC